MMWDSNGARLPSVTELERGQGFEPGYSSVDITDPLPDEAKRDFLGNSMNASITKRFLRNILTLPSSGINQAADITLMRPPAALLTITVGPWLSRR